MPETPWAKLGSLFVTREHAEHAARQGRPIAIYPSGLESLSSSFSPGSSGASELRRQSSYVGTLPSAGVVDMDSNRKLRPSDLRGDLGYVGIYDQMRLEDPVIKAITAAWTLPIMRSAWTVEPNGDDRPALELAEFVQANLWEYMRGGFYAFIEQAVTAVWRGFSLFEIVFKFDKSIGKIRLDELSPMLPRTIYEWGRYPDGRWGCIQQAYTGDPDVGRSLADYSTTAFGPDKLLHFAWDPAGDDPEGTSILRPCYGGWKSRRLYLKLEATGYERGAFGIPYVEVDPAARTGDSATVNEILRELRTGARAWASFPPGYSLKFADFPMKGTDIREARRAAGMDMARSALAPFLFTGEPGAGGAYALVKGHQDFFQMALQTCADGLAALLSDGPNSLIKRLVSMNYDGVNAYPYLSPGAISIGDPDKLVKAIKAATEAGVLMPDRQIEDSVRSALGLPEVTDGTPPQANAPIEVEPGEPPPSPPTPATRKEQKGTTDEQDEKIEEDAKGLEAMADRLVINELQGPRLARNGRELRPEETVVRLDETLAPMVGTKEAVAHTVKTWRDAIAPIYADRLAKAGDLGKMRTVQVPDQGKLVQILQVELRRAYRAGREAVRSEVERIEADPELAQKIAEGEVEVTRDEVIVEGEALAGQLRLPGCGCSKPRPGMLVALTELLAKLPKKPVKRRKVRAPKPKADGESLADDIDPEKMIRAIAETTADRAADRIKNDSMTAVQAASLGGEIEGEDIVEIVRASLAGLSIGQDLVQAQRDVNTVFGVGRIQEARAEDVEYGIYSTMLESNTCPACEIKDGAEFPISKLDDYATPNPECLGGDMCNCLILFVPKQG